MYFNNFPKIYYDFPQDATSTELQILTDITLNVRVRKEILENITLYDEYDIQEGETPEIIAEKVYGNPELHWVIMLVNQKYDYLRDFPMTSAELYAHCEQTYGTDRVYMTHHYEKNGLVVDGRAFVKVPTVLSDASLDITDFKVYDLIKSSHGTGRIESINANTRTLTVLLENGTFPTGDIVTVTGNRPNDARQNVYKSICNFVIPPNGFSLAAEYSVAVSNYDYENRLNEKKRRIKLISSSLLDQFLREFRALIAG